jgi:DNA-binding IclR family transcriptional regulator
MRTSVSIMPKTSLPSTPASKAANRAKALASSARLAKPKAAKSQAGIQSVEVGFALLEALTQAPGPMMLRDIALAAKMSPAKAHRYLVSYQRLGLVTQDGDNTRYDLGPAALKLGLACLERLDAVKLARQHMDALMDEIGHTVAIAVWGNHGPVIVHWQEPARAVTVNLRLGDVMPLLGSATGRCFAAFAPAAQTASLLKAELALLTKSPRAGLPANAHEAAALLEETRQQGLARVVDTLLPGISGMAVPVWDAAGRICLSLVSLGSSASFDARTTGVVARALVSCAAQLGQALGASPVSKNA